MRLREATRLLHGGTLGWVEGRFSSIAWEKSRHALNRLKRGFDLGKTFIAVSFRLKKVIFEDGKKIWNVPESGMLGVYVRAVSKRR